MRFSQSLTTMYYLLMTEYYIAKQTIYDKLIDLCIWIVSVGLIVVYFYPQFGMDITYGSFMIAGMTASAGLSELWASATRLISDFEGNNVTAYYLMLPMPSWLTFVSYMTFNAINSALLTLPVIPLCKLIFWNRFDLSHLSYHKYIIIFFLTNIFYATLTAWITSMIPNLERIGSVWMRFLYPLWMFGAYQYSYQLLFTMHPTLAYISLINPFLYVMEGTRAAILGQQGSLNFWICSAMIALFSVLCAFHAIHRLKKRLDYV